MEMIKAKITKRFALRNTKGEVENKIFYKGDEYTDKELGKKNFEILKDYRYHGALVFDLFKSEGKVKEEKVETKKEETLEEVQARYTEVTGKKVPSQEIYGQNKEWLLGKIESHK